MTKPNGHDRSASALGGHSLPLSSREVRGARLASGGAASDDRRDFPAAAGASAPAGMERDASAEVAPSGGRKKITAAPGPGAQANGGHGANGHATLVYGSSSETAVKEGPHHMATSRKGQENTAVDIPPGIRPLASDGQGFVDAMHAHVDLYLACTRLVKSSDEKIAQRMVERLLEMSYGKSPSPQTEDAAPPSFGPAHSPQD